MKSIETRRFEQLTEEERPKFRGGSNSGPCIDYLHERGLCNGGNCIEWFGASWSKEMILNFVNSITNAFGRHYQSKWKDFSLYEFFDFLAICLAFGLVQTRNREMAFRDMRLDARSHEL